MRGSRAWVPAAQHADAQMSRNSTEDAVGPMEPNEHDDDDREPKYEMDPAKHDAAVRQDFLAEIKEAISNGMPVLTAPPSHPTPVCMMQQAPCVAAVAWSAIFLCMTFERGVSAAAVASSTGRATKSASRWRCGSAAARLAPTASALCARYSPLTALIRRSAAPWLGSWLASTVQAKASFDGASRYLRQARCSAAMPRLLWHVP